MANGNDWDQTLSRPWIVFSFGGPSAPVTEASVEYSIDTISARSTFAFPEPPAIEINQQVFANGGYRTGAFATSNYLLFAGFIEDDDVKYLDLTNTLSVGDRLRLTQFPIGDAFYDEDPFDFVAIFDGTTLPGGDPSPTNNAPPGGWTDTLIARFLLALSGINSGNAGLNYTNDPLLVGINGRDIQMAQIQPIVLKNSETPADLLKRIDDVTGCATFSTPSGPKRIPTTFTPAASAAWALHEGEQLLDVDSKRSIRQFHNKVIVKGLRIGGAQFISVRRADPNLPPAPGGAPGELPYGRVQDLTYKIQQDLVQSQEHADQLSAILMTVHNRVARNFGATTGFNPQAEPGQTVEFLAPNAKVSEPINAFVTGVKHSFNDNGAWTEWSLAIYDGDAGVLIGQPPTVAVLAPIFSGPITDTNGNVLWTITLDGSISSDPDNPPDAIQAGLTFAWSDSLGGSGTDPIYSILVDDATLGATPAPTVTLTITDPQANVSTVTIPLVRP